MEKTDVAARTKGPERTFLAHATHHHGQHMGVVAPGDQGRRDVADHAQRQRVERPGPVQRDAADAATNLGHDKGFRSKRVGHGRDPRFGRFRIRGRRY
ncbi:hypothetical protein D9M68_898280 [compost metagenome]